MVHHRERENWDLRVWFCWFSTCRSEASCRSCNWSSGESVGECCGGSFPESGGGGSPGLTSGAYDKTPRKGVQLTAVYVLCTWQPDTTIDFLYTTIALVAKSPPLSWWEYHNLHIKDQFWHCYISGINSALPCMAFCSIPPSTTPPYRWFPSYQGTDKGNSLTKGSRIVIGIYLLSPHLVLAIGGGLRFNHHRPLLLILLLKPYL